MQKMIFQVVTVGQKRFFCRINAARLMQGQPPSEMQPLKCDGSKLKYNCDSNYITADSTYFTFLQFFQTRLLMMPQNLGMSLS